MKKWKIVIAVLILLLIGLVFYIRERDYEMRQVELLEQAKEERKQLIANIEKHYNEKVLITKDTDLYENKNDKYKKAGSIKKDMYIELDEHPKKQEAYFKLKELDLYVYYEDVTPVDEIPVDTTYQSYVPFNLDIVTNKKNVDFYDTKATKLITFNQEKTFTVIGKTTDRYYVEFNHMFGYILKEDIAKEVESHHSDQEIASEIAVLNYHFFYDQANGESCNQIICHEKQVFTEHLNYLRDQQFFTVDMSSFSMFLDGTIQLPKKSVLITIDDGGQGVKEIAIPMLTEYKMHATIFLVTSWYNPTEYENDYIECHSHTHNMHDVGVCPTEYGQGGGLLCLDSELIKNDLQASRDALHGSTILAYPLYDYNDYAIEQLKTNGFTMAFIGDSRKAKVGEDHYKIPRFPVSTSWSQETFINVVN